jgi:hypothetical protein
MIAETVLPVSAAGNTTTEARLPSSFNLMEDGGKDLSTSLDLSTEKLEASASGTSFGKGMEGDSVLLYQKDGKYTYTPDAIQECLILNRDFGAEDVSIFRMDDSAVSAGTPEKRIKTALEKKEAVVLDGKQLVVGWKSTGSWLVRPADQSVKTLTEIPYGDSSIASAEVLCASFPEDSSRILTYRFDGGIGEGVYTPTLQAGVSSADGYSMANVFQASGDGKLTEISFCTAGAAEYSVRILTDLTDPENPSSGSQAWAQDQTGSTDGAGLHNVKLDSAVDLKTGTSFAVCVRFSDASAEICYDASQTLNDASGNAVFTSVSAAAEGQGFISRDGVSWTDFSGNGSLRIHALEETASSDTASDVPADMTSLNDYSTPLENGGIYYIRSYTQSSCVLDVSDASCNNGGNVQIWDYNGTNAQKWIAEQSGSGYVFISLNSGRALDVQNGSVSDGGNIQQYRMNGTEAQSWNLESNSDGSWTLISAKSGKAADISGGQISAGTNLQIYFSNGTDAQKFTFEKADSPAVTTERSILRPQCATGKCLDLAQGSTDSGTNVQLYILNHTAAQDFQLVDTGSGYYKIMHSSSGRVLDAAGGMSSEGTNIQLYDDNGTLAQRWRAVINYDGSYTFFSALQPDMAITVSGSGSVDGTNIDLESYRGGYCQRFITTERIQNDLQGTYSIRSAKNTDRTLDVASGSMDNGANIQSYDSNGTAAQHFTLSRVRDDIYVIYRAGTDMVLDVTGGIIGDGSNVQLYSYNGTEAQQWEITDNVNGTYTIHSVLDTDYVLDVAGGSTAYRANIQTWTSNGTYAQQWYLASETVSSCRLTSADTVSVSGSGQASGSDDGRLYLFAVPNYAEDIEGYEPAASASASDSFSISASLDRYSESSHLQDKFYTAIMKDGLYHIISNGYYIQNPEACAEKSTARLSTANKKGLATSGWGYIDKAIELGVSHVAENMPILSWVSGEGYDYTYEGVTYSFNSALSVYIDHVKKLNAAGIEVTGIVYMDAVGAASEYAQYITPNGRDVVSEGAAIAGINAVEKGPRKKLEAMFACLADAFSDSDCQIGNWVIGNEIDNPVNWNWCGYGLSTDEYCQLNADIYRMAYTAMKSVWSNVRVYTSLDHVWNTGSRGSSYYTAMDVLSQLDNILKGEGFISWDLAFHPYCVPEQDCRIWNREGLTDDASTPLISMINIGVLTDYVNSMGSGHHIILSESGFCSYYPNENLQLQNEQAAAIAYSYYIAEANPYLDNFIVHQLKDDQGEMNGGWYLGICNADMTAKPAYQVFKEMDKSNWEWIQTYACPYIRAGSTWASLIPNFNPASFVRK